MLKQTRSLGHGGYRRKSRCWQWKWNKFRIDKEGADPALHVPCRTETNELNSIESNIVGSHSDNEDVNSNNDNEPGTDFVRRMTKSIFCMKLTCPIDMQYCFAQTYAASNQTHVQQSLGCCAL